MVSQVHRRHRGESREYAKVLEQRNSLLRALRIDVRPSAIEWGSAGAGQAGPGRTMELGFWDSELVRLAGSVSLPRVRAGGGLPPPAPADPAGLCWRGPPSLAPPRAVAG